MTKFGMQDRLTDWLSGARANAGKRALYRTNSVRDRYINDDYGRIDLPIGKAAELEESTSPALPQYPPRLYDTVVHVPHPAG